MDYGELLSYSQRVSKHSMSPLNANSWVIEPPIPQDIHMRMSLLFQQEQLLQSLGLSWTSGLSSELRSGDEQQPDNLFGIADGGGVDAEMGDLFGFEAHADAMAQKHQSPEELLDLDLV